LIQYQNLLNPTMLFFGLGLFAQVIRSDLKLPADLVKSITIYLLISIGIHGGVELAHASISNAIPAILIAVLLGLLIPIVAFLILNKVGKIDSLNAVAIATHYGSVSAGTFLTAIAFLESLNISYEKYPVVMLAMMESPAILVGLFTASVIRKKMGTAATQVASDHNNINVLKEALTNGSIVLLFGGLLIGDVVPDKNLKVVAPFFDQMFMGVLCMFLLAMGMEAGKKLHEFKQAGMFLTGFGILMPIILGLIGVLLGVYALNFGIGGSTLVGVLAASASYIAVPPAMRIAIPEANPSLYLTLSLGITFPFNVLFGIPLYFYFASNLLKG
jgi:hypothetical protein